jgi:hypothetical protein
MVEYGNGVGEVAGRTGGGAGAGGGSMDVGAAFGQFVANTTDTLATAPPEVLLVGLVVVVLGLIMFKRAF